MASETLRTQTRSVRRPWRTSAFAAAAIVLGTSLTLMSPASAQTAPQSPGLLGADLGVDLTGQEPLIGIGVDLSGLLGDGSGAQVGVNADSGVAAVDVTAGMSGVGAGDLNAVVGGERVAGVQAGATVANVDATASADLMNRNGSLASVCGDVRVGIARCGAEGALLGLGVTDVLGANAMALADGAAGSNVLSACLDLTLGSASQCSAAAAPADPTDSTLGGPTDDLPGPTVPPLNLTVRDVDLFRVFQTGTDTSVAGDGLGGTRVAALAFTGLGVAGLAAVGLASIGGGTILTRLFRRTGADAAA